ncbi:MAG: DUF371 domain-containing protein [Candidatus Aenigmatarchaeota archaeon]
MIEFIIRAKGNPKISARDPQKIVITKGKEVFDDSVIAVEASAAAADLPDDFKTAIRDRKKLSLTIGTAGNEDVIFAFGSFEAKVTDKNNIVVTKSDFIDNATIGVRSNKAASDLLRELVALLQTDNQEITILLQVTE